MRAVDEQVAHPSMDRAEMMNVMRRIETPHLSLSLPGRLMRHFRPAIGVWAGVVVSTPRDFPDGQRVFFQPICIEPNGVADDLGREPAAVISGFAFAHRRIVPNTRLRDDAKRAFIPLVLLH